jgi:hypothetical protein
MDWPQRLEGKVESTPPDVGPQQLHPTLDYHSTGAGRPVWGGNYDLGSVWTHILGRPDRGWFD